MIAPLSHQFTGEYNRTLRAQNGLRQPGFAFSTVLLADGNRIAVPLQTAPLQTAPLHGGKTGVILDNQYFRQNAASLQEAA